MAEIAYIYPTNRHLVRIGSTSRHRYQVTLLLNLVTLWVVDYIFPKTNRHSSSKGSTWRLINWTAFLYTCTSDALWGLQKEYSYLNFNFTWQWYSWGETATLFPHISPKCSVFSVMAGKQCVTGNFKMRPQCKHFSRFATDTAEDSFNWNKLCISYQ